MVREAAQVLVAVTASGRLELLPSRREPHSLPILGGLLPRLGVGRVAGTPLRNVRGRQFWENEAMAAKPAPATTARLAHSGRGGQPTAAPGSTAAPSIGLCRLPSGSQVAYATLGKGPPLVMVPGWLCHVEKVWTHPAARSARDKLAEAHRFVWYDRLGCGLSDRDGFTPSIENDVEQLEAVLDATGSERCSLIGYSFGGPAAATLAARHPERVDRLVLYSTYARGRALASDEQHESLKALIRGNWALGTRALATILVPNGSPQDLSWFSRFQRDAATPEMAVTLLDAMRNHDAREALVQVRAPTLVLTNRHDPAIRPDNSREVAALVPEAVLHVLDGNEHEPFIRDSGSVVEAILNFVDRRPLSSPKLDVAPALALSPRETEVLQLLAAGEPNKVIARRLGIGVATVERHVASIYRKLGARGRADAALHAVALGLAPVPVR